MGEASQMRCQKVREQLNILCDGERLASAGLYPMVLRHWLSCASCRAAWRRLKRERQDCRQLPGPPVPSDLAARLQSALPTARDMPRAGSPIRSRPLLWVIHWGVVALLVMALVSFWPANRWDRGVVEAALRASAAAPALHVVGRGTREHQELWYRQGVGVYLYGKNPKHETILVDDLRHYYRYEIREHRVYVTRSLLASPTGVALFWTSHSGAGLLKQMLQVWGPGSVRVETVTREGRVLQQLVGPRRVSRVTIDPETDRIQSIDVDLPHPDGTSERTRTDFDYPDPATVDPHHFVFHVPPGVTVVDQTGRR